jgi:hypothetical protein
MDNVANQLTSFTAKKLIITINIKIKLTFPLFNRLPTDITSLSVCPIIPYLMTQRAKAPVIFFQVKEARINVLGQHKKMEEMIKQNKHRFCLRIKMR